MSRRSLLGRLARVATLTLLPLSLIPLMAVVPALVEGHASFSRLYLQRGTLDPPSTALTAAQRRAFVPLPTFRTAVPVLAYHGINDASDEYSLTREQFAAQMAMLHQAGFHTISAAQFASYPGGSARDLPTRPILITFDDGRLDSYRGADKILAQYGMRATMFVIASETDKRNPFYLRWNELRRMAASGRWDIQLHAGRGHVKVPIGHGHRGAFYANRELVGGRLETFDAYRQRVRGDLAYGTNRMRSEIPNFAPLLFAIPYAADGDAQTNDPRIAPFLDEELHLRFRQVFLSGDPVSPPREAQRTLRRMEPHADVTPIALYRWLAIDPRTPEQRQEQAARQVERLRAAHQPVAPALLVQAGLPPEEATAPPRVTHERISANGGAPTSHRRTSARKRRAAARRAAARRAATRRRAAARRSHARRRGHK